ncbi:tripartite tricarboxylate transporter substrate binding protein, partial [Acinetobacter baumannii]|nr:tripartite tricarboxylate transporter substrate binding protein [Acinetobacter baumannii]MCW1766370.1 tripartite tricarboxylate transporter substrate binding protein [Acinetobacter baumannii]
FKNDKVHPATDFAPVTKIYDLPTVIAVNAQSLPKVTDLKALFQYAKAQPATLDYTSSGAGSSGHLSMELLKQMAGFDMQHVPYKGGAPALQDVLGNRVTSFYAAPPTALPHIESGKLIPLATTGLTRPAYLPNVPTVAESFPGFNATNWYAFVASAKTPKP